MKKNLLFFSFLFCSLFVWAQNDIITRHNGQVIEGNVIRVEEYVVIFKYAAEDSEQTLGKYAIDKIVYGKSGREEKITDKIIIDSPADYKKVMIVEDKSYVIGLTSMGEIKGKTGWINLHTYNTADRKSQEKLQKEAAKQGCQFVLITSQSSSVGSSSNLLGGSQTVKKGFGYKY